MKYLLDTNILLRLVELAHAQHKEASEALKTLRRQNCVFYILLQNVSEFWNVCTRPKDKNGLGLSMLKPIRIWKDSNDFSLFCPTPKKFIETGAS